MKLEEMIEEAMLLYFDGIKKVRANQLELEEELNTVEKKIAGNKYLNEELISRWTDLNCVISAEVKDIEKVTALYESIKKIHEKLASNS